MNYDEAVIELNKYDYLEKRYHKKEIEGILVVPVDSGLFSQFIDQLLNNLVNEINPDQAADSSERILRACGELQVIVLYDFQHYRSFGGLLHWQNAREINTQHLRS